MIDYSKPGKSSNKVDYSHPTRPRRVPTPDSDGVIRLRRGESVVLGSSR